MVLEQIQPTETYSLKHMASVKSNDSAYKATRPSRILRSEKLVTPVTSLLQDYLDHFIPFSRSQTAIQY